MRPDTHSTVTPDGDIVAVDWTGRAIDAATCAVCSHAALRADGGCEPGRTCMQDAYARRIDRFFRTHPALANAHLAHPYFEVRAIAARHADVFQLQPLMDDDDETVRLQVALRVSQRLLQRMLHDPHREVRIRVAQRIATEALSGLLGDSDYQVRCIVAKRLPVGLLPLLMHDSDLQVRLAVAQRLPMPALWNLASDGAAEVRRVVAQRLPGPLLQVLAGDADWRVRWEVAGRARGDTLRGLLADAEADVRERAGERCAELGDERRQERGGEHSVASVRSLRDQEAQHV
jgi:LRV protein FeS4 cluster/Leucine rich repeat variant